ncbi:unnamed protein product [Bursaphelenchus xylophilus]|uniref:(pine wood nematode) hypothetical protein n=1 Tax=Bursaphelenchus xylophilus TaxID=6326 RepID=A0A7I8X540_BURXY|nr:unnamed protein product [Bursaphelenchus xylophilus]CAG9122477.1 unnamed protein product [Bursaphelenchus xylophilus]
MKLRYTLDPSLKRQKIGEIHTRMGTLEACFIHEKDWPIVVQFLANEFGANEPINHALELRPEDTIRGFEEQVETKWAPSNVSIIAIRNNELAGAIINWIVPVDRSKKCEPAKIQSDYGELIKQMRSEIDDFTSNFPKVIGVIGDLEESVPYYIPEDADRFFRIDIICVFMDFQGLGLAKFLWNLSLKIASDRGISPVESICTAVATQKIARSTGFNSVFQMPYNKVRENGQYLFQTPLIDGSESAHLMIKNLHQSENIQPC